MEKASVQQDLKGAFVVQRTESRRFTRYTQGAYEAVLPNGAPEAVQKRLSAMESAKLPESDGGDRKFSDEQIQAWLEAWAENKVRTRPGVKRSEKKKDDREGLIAELLNFVRGDAEPTCHKTPFARRAVIFSTDKFRVKAGESSLENRLQRWRDRVKKAAAKATGKKGKEKLAEMERAVEGQQRQWVKASMRFLPKATTDEKGEHEAHAARLFDAIIEGKGLRKIKKN